MNTDINAVAIALHEALKVFDEAEPEAVAYALILRAAECLGYIEDDDKREDDLDIMLEVLARQTRINAAVMGVASEMRPCSVRGERTG